MAETCFLAEATICYPPLFNELRSLTPRPTPTVETVAMSAVAASLEQNAGAILVMSTSGNTARLISKYRPSCPILTCECKFIAMHGVIHIRHSSDEERSNRQTNPFTQRLLPILL